MKSKSCAVVKIEELKGHASIVRYIHATDQGKNEAPVRFSALRFELADTCKRLFELPIELHRFVSPQAGLSKS